MCAISTFSCEQVQVKPLNIRPPCLGTLSMRRSLVAPLSGAAQCDIVIAIYRIRLSFAGNELGNAPTVWKQLRWRRCLDLICTSGQRRTNTLVARTYARWPLRASGVLDPLARRVKKAVGPAVSVEAWVRMTKRKETVGGRQKKMTNIIVIHQIANCPTKYLQTV